MYLSLGEFFSLKSNYSSLSDLHSDIETELLNRCIRCGDCVSSCPAFNQSIHKDEDPVDVAKSMFKVLHGGEVSDEAYHKAFSCSVCEECIDLCPEGLNPMMLNQMVRSKLTAAGKEAPPGMNFLLPEKAPFLPEVLGAIQSKPSEARWYTEAPANAPQKDIVVFLGCVSLAAPAMNNALMNVLESMKLDFAALIGSSKLCCGFTQFFAGEIDECERSVKKLMTNVRAFSPKKVILPCPGCYNSFRNLYPLLFNMDFEVQYLPEFLSQNMDTLTFTQTLDASVTLHEPCHLARSIKDYDSPRKILDALPGVKFVEMDGCKENALCCGGLAAVNYPEYAPGLVGPLLEKTEETKADFMVNLCATCHVILSAFQPVSSFGLTNIPALINDALGNPTYEDKLVKYRKYGDPQKILEEARECIEASDFTFEEMKNIIPMVFGG